MFYANVLQVYIGSNTLLFLLFPKHKKYDKECVIPEKVILGVKLNFERVTHLTVEHS